MTVNTATVVCSMLPSSVVGFDVFVARTDQRSESWERLWAWGWGENQTWKLARSTVWGGRALSPAHRGKRICCIS